MRDAVGILALQGGEDVKICDSETEAMRVERDVHQALFEFATTGGFGGLSTPFSNHAHSAVVTFF